MTNKLHTGKVIITNEGPPIYNGAFSIENNIITKIGKKIDFGSLENYEIIDHGNTLICPGFINLHTHLAYTHAEGICGNNGLFNWIKSLLRKTKTWSEKEIRDSTKSGIKELLLSGTTYIIENTSSDVCIDEITKSSIKALIGIEVFGTENDKGIVFNNYLKKLSKLEQTYQLNDFTFSPHAPYNVSNHLWKNLCAWSKTNNKALLTHLEESKDESLWWKEKSGSAIELWKETGSLQNKINDWKKHKSGIDFLYRNNLLPTSLIAAHLCEASIDDLKLLKKHHATIVHCPRSNHYLNNKIPSLKLWDEVGIPWSIGTDSKASNSDLNILNELRFAVNKQLELYEYKMTSKDAFEHITKIPGEILGGKNKLGSLAVNSFADFIIYDNIEKLIDFNIDPYEHIIFNMEDKNDLSEVWINGNKILSLEKV